ncbi:MAG: hypothetical protein K2Q34_01480 [Alphaproteobacteria bacterium]|nr:hypothetical protein [Alphaproteobacteria bacterium]
MIKTLLNWDKEASKNTSILLGVFGGIVFLFWLFYWMCPPDVKLFTDDADSYIHYGPTRTIGYPVVLSLVKLLTGGYQAISFVQLTTLCVSVFVAAVSLVRFLKSFVLGMIFILATLGLSEIVKFCFEIYTESLGVSLLLLLAAAILSYINTKKKNEESNLLDRHASLAMTDSPSSLRGAQRRGNPGTLKQEWPLFIIGLLVGLLVLLRPSSYALLGAVFVLFLVYIPKIIDVFKLCILPLAICLLMGAGVNYFHHGFFSTQSFMGHNLFGKTAFVVKDAMQSTDLIEAEIIQKMAAGMAPLQNELDQIVSLKLYYILSTPLHDKLRFFLLDRKFKPDIPELSEHPDLDGFYKNVALRIIAQNPTAYLKDVMIHYGAMWFIWDLITPSEKELLVSWIDHLKETDAFKQIEQDYSWYKFREKGELTIFLIRGFLYFCFCLSFAFIGRGLWCFVKRKPLPRAWGMGLFLSTAIHLIYFSTALFQAGYPRYSMFMWPYLFMMVLVFMGIGFDSFRKEKISDQF